MEQTITYAALAKSAGISAGYAHDILSGKRSPSRSLAIHIFRQTNWRHSLIADLTDEQIEVLETVDPWPKVAA